MAGFQHFILIFLCIFSAVSATAQCPGNVHFECPDKCSQKVIMNGVSELACPFGKVCNCNCVATGNGEINACEDIVNVCPYECENFDTVSIQGIFYNCPDGKECNAAKTSCEVCVNKSCDPTLFTCKTQRVVLFADGSRMTCPWGKVCNKDHQYPCQPCISS